MNAARWLVPAASGCLLALALAFGGLTRPEVVIGWVDWFGRWDLQLLAFFLPATVVYGLAVRLARWRLKRFGGPELGLSTSRNIDGRLVLGAAIFGIGWGIGGACPGPALVSLSTGAPWAVVFVAAMVLGLHLRWPVAIAQRETISI
ncbi:MAG TPA: DUF6691 family protein [Polyangiaceae bacterium]|jgi:uncharacterized membrane protein YedE/YeeE|nr:DUF6691 family protein [Polyangiaceae bacterium]